MHGANPDDFGTNYYSYIKGERHLVGALRTIRPMRGESCARFEERMDGLSRIISTVEVYDGAHVVAETLSVQLIWRNGLIAECVFEYRHAPIPAPIVIVRQLKQAA